MGNDPKQDDQYERIGDNVSIFRRGRWWHANYQMGGKQRRVALGARGQQEARRLARKLEMDILDGQDPRRKPAPTVSEAVDKYLAYLRTEARRSKTMVKYANVLKRLVALCEELKVRDISGLDLNVMDAYRARRVAAGRAKKTIYTESVIVRQLVKFALSRNMIAEDPMKGLKLKKPKPTRQPCWTPVVMDEIIAAATEPARSCFAILKETGLRVGELVHQAWDDDVDFDAGFIHVRGKDDWLPKTEDERSVPMSPSLRQTLAALPRYGRWVVTMPPTRKYPQLDRQMRDRWLLSQLKRILKKLGLTGHVHTFRHSFVSHALNSGTAESIVRKWVGHVDPEILKLYTHVADDISKDAMDRLNAGDAAGDDEQDGQQPAAVAG